MLMKEKPPGYHERVQHAVDYIERHLTEEISLQEVSNRANTSIFHFHRLFRAFTGRSLTEYIRERRLYFAAGELAQTRKLIIDIAFEYGYSTPESFLRAFKARYGVTPRAFRKKGTSPPFMSKVNLEEGAPIGAIGTIVMNPRIKVISQMRLRGTRIDTIHSSCHADVENLWRRITDPEAGNPLLNPESITAVYGVCYGACGGCACTGLSRSSGSGEEFSYFVGYETDADGGPPEGEFETCIGGGEYAVFSVRPGEMRETMDRIYSAWLPSSGYELAGRPVIERYGSDWMSREGEEMEIWLPVEAAGV